MEIAKLVYITYIRSTPKDVWAAITKPEFTAQYWGKPCRGTVYRATFSI